MEVHSTVAYIKNIQKLYFRLIGLGANGYPHIRGLGYDTETTWESLYSNDMSQLDDFIIYYYIGRDFAYIQDKKILVCTITCDPINDLYMRENDYSSRVPFANTKFPQHKDFADCFVSNMYFCTKGSALMLGHFECLLRTNQNPFLYEKLLPSKPKLPFKNHYKLLFDYLLGNTKDAKEIRARLISNYIEYDFDSPDSVQKLADTFCVGICVINMKSQFEYTKYMILPELPEINPIPIVKLITYGYYTCVLYSNTQNEYDGFDENGKIKKSYENEMILDSFYIVEEKSKTTNYEIFDIVNKLSECFLNENDKNSIEKLNEVITLIESNDESNGSLSNSVKCLKKAIDKIKQKSLSSQTPEMPSRKIMTPVNTINKITSPSANIQLSKIDKQYEYPQKVHNIKDKITNASKISTNNKIQFIINSNQISPAIQITNFNSMFEIFSTPSTSIDLKSNESENLQKQDEISKLDACNKLKTVQFSHNTCLICQECINSINDKNPKCYECGKIINSGVMDKKELTCGLCGYVGKIYAMPCDCLICENCCKNKNHK
ncbi:hypothetical protein SteCoe_25867 [Stentor coeruleus]|uniref:Uncharacterized protein n=1 Tax=Stentor coeruleus TaxID=5963 RepID=A0A1R2BE84_9CILI|nr:hypothetical protein SteCoe_25867 [Stentor coeruleus]